MKNYRILVPIVMIVLYVASFYMLVDAKKEENEEYNFYLDSAREYWEQDIIVDAKVNYAAAYEMIQSLDLALEIGSLYMEDSTFTNAINWGEDVIIEDFPMDIEGYEFLTAIFYEQGDYVSFYEIVEVVEARNLSSTLIDEMESEIAYTFFYNGEYDDVGIYSGDLCPVLTGTNWGYANLNGNKTISSAYSTVGYFASDLAPVVGQDGLAYFIDTEGNKKKVIVDVDNVEEIGTIASGLFPVYNGSSWGFYNMDNEFVFGEYDEVSITGNGIAAVKSDEMWSLVDVEGTLITSNQYENVAMDEKDTVYRNGIIFVYEDYYYTMIDGTGKQVGNGQYQDVDIFYDETYAAVKIDNKWGFVDNTGKVVIEPIYEEANSFSNGYAAVKFAGQWGFINMDNEVVIDYQFDDAKYFTSQGSVFVKIEDTWKLLRLYKYNY